MPARWSCRSETSRGAPSWPSGPTAARSPTTGRTSSRTATARSPRSGNSTTPPPWSRPTGP